MTVSGDGTRLVATWYRSDGTYPRVQTRSSADGGTTWSTATDLSDPGGSAYAPQITTSDDGMISSVAWYRYDGSRWVVQTRSSTDAGATWTPVANLSDPTGDSRNPAIAASADGRTLSVIWRHDDGTHYRIQSRSSTDAGATWTPVRTLSDPGQDAFDPQVVVSAAGTRLAGVWRRGDGTHQIVQTSSSTDAGATWSPSANLSDPGQNAMDPQITTSADGTRIAAVWSRSDGTYNRVQTRSSSDGGNTWAPVANLSDPGQNAQQARVTASTDGTRLTTTWRSSDVTPVIQTRSSSDGGTTWTPVGTLSDASRFGDQARLAASDDGTRLVATWYSSSGATDIRVDSASSADAGQSWSAPMVVSAPGEYCDPPQVAASADGTRLASVWRRSDGTNARAEVVIGSLSTVPGAPTQVAAKPKPKAAKVSWTPPADDGNSPITGYTATAQPGGQGCTTTGTGCTITGLTNRTTYTVTVTATNALGTGPASAPVSVTPAPKAIAVAKAVAGRSKLKVRIKPNLGPRKQWKFTVKKRIDGVWTTLTRNNGTTKVYKTRGPKHIRVLNLPKGRYKARSRAARGYLYDYSRVVRLRK